ncbi:MAG TPA: hypothetical protein VNH19_08545, partial [Candidatus Limnocylindrales bacterium]|nr:hypothetical protein [Candidatus Limnocylindrales bacterium]
MAVIWGSIPRWCDVFSGYGDGSGDGDGDGDGYGSGYGYGDGSGYGYGYGSKEYWQSTVRYFAEK